MKQEGVPPKAVKPSMGGAACPARCLGGPNHMLSPGVPAAHDNRAPVLTWSSSPGEELVHITCQELAELGSEPWLPSLEPLSLALGFCCPAHFLPLVTPRVGPVHSHCLHVVSRGHLSIRLRRADSPAWSGNVVCMALPRMHLTFNCSATVPLGPFHR